MRFQVLPCLVLLAAAAPAQAQVTGGQAEISREDVARMDEQRQRFSAWQDRLRDAFLAGGRGIEPARTAMMAVFDRPQSAEAAKRARAAIAEARTLVAQSSATLEALTLPDVSLLQLGEAVQPARLRASLLDVNANRLAVLASWIKALDALARRDNKALRVAFDGGKVATLQSLDTLALLCDARAASEPGFASYYELLAVVYRAQRRVMATVAFEGLSRDPAFARDMEALARRVDEIIGRGEERARARRTQLTDDIERARAAGRGDVADLLEGELRGIDTYQAIFVLGRELAGELRALGSASPPAGLTQAAFRGITRRLADFDRRFAELGVQIRRDQVAPVAR